MSDQSIASIARSLAAALLAACRHPRSADCQEPNRVAALETELCAEYRAEMIEALKVIA
jgi:hypothetical protein